MLDFLAVTSILAPNRLRVGNQNQDGTPSSYEAGGLKLRVEEVEARAKFLQEAEILPTPEPAPEQEADRGERLKKAYRGTLKKDEKKDE